MAAQYLDIIILLVVVVVIFNRLKNVIGTHPDQVENSKIAEENAAKIFDLIVKEAEKQQNPQISENTVSQENTPENQTAEMSEIDKTLSKIPGFDKAVFINGAKRAFEIIVAAFGSQDTQTLEMLVSGNLFKKFQTVIEKRRAEGITAETDFIGFDEVEITHAEVSADGVAKITVKFVSQQVNMLKDAEGNVIEGDECYIQNITDIWTFEKSVSSTNPNWLLVSTKK